MPKIVAHVGLPKTATTTLQHHVFLKHPDIFTMSMLGTGVSRNLCAILDELNRTPLEAVQPIIDAFHHEIKKFDDHRPRILTREDFMFPRKTDLPTAAEKLKRSIGDASIVIVIRNQLAWLESYYFHHQRRHSSRKIVLPEQYLEVETQKGDRGALAAMYFDDLIGTWENAFGRKNISVVPVEWLKTNRSAFFKPFAEPLGLGTKTFETLFEQAPRENERFSMDDFHAGRIKSHMRRSAPLLFLAARLSKFDFGAAGSLDRQPAHFDFSTIVPEKTKNQWSAQNKEIARRYKLDLNALGYL